MKFYPPPPKVVSENKPVGYQIHMNTNAPNVRTSSEQQTFNNTKLEPKIGSLPILNHKQNDFSSIAWPIDTNSKTPSNFPIMSQFASSMVEKNNKATISMEQNQLPTRSQQFVSGDFSNLQHSFKNVQPLLVPSPVPSMIPSIIPGNVFKDEQFSTLPSHDKFSNFTQDRKVVSSLFKGESNVNNQKSKMITINETTTHKQHTTGISSKKTQRQRGRPPKSKKNSKVVRTRVSRHHFSKNQKNVHYDQLKAKLDMNTERILELNQYKGDIVLDNNIPYGGSPSIAEFLFSFAPTYRIEPFCGFIDSFIRKICEYDLPPLIHIKQKQNEANYQIMYEFPEFYEEKIFKPFMQWKNFVSKERRKDFQGKVPFANIFNYKYLLFILTPVIDSLIASDFNQLKNSSVQITNDIMKALNTPYPNGFEFDLEKGFILAPDKAKLITQENDILVLKNNLGILDTQTKVQSVQQGNSIIQELIKKQRGRKPNTMLEKDRAVQQLEEKGILRFETINIDPFLSIDRLNYNMVQLSRFRIVLKKQLPKMPLEYSAKQIFDKHHMTLVCITDVRHSNMVKKHAELIESIKETRNKKEMVHIEDEVDEMTETIAWDTNKKYCDVKTGSNSNSTDNNVNETTLKVVPGIDTLNFIESVASERVVGGICFRPEPEREFVEVVFVCVHQDTQTAGYGTRMMNHLKEYAKKIGCKFLLTYADNTAIDFFRKQGFTTKLSKEHLPKWVGVIKDYVQSTLMECRLYKEINYLKVPQLIDFQWQQLFKRMEYVRVKPQKMVFDSKNDVYPKDIKLFRELPFAEKEMGLSFIQITNLYEKFLYIWNCLYEHPYSWPFREPVTIFEAQDYYLKVNDPIDLKLIKERLNAFENIRIVRHMIDNNDVDYKVKQFQQFNSSQYDIAELDIKPEDFVIISREKVSSYYRTVDMFVNDCELIFRNCFSYNSSDTPYNHCGRILNNVLIELVNEEFPGVYSTQQTNDQMIVSGNHKKEFSYDRAQTPLKPVFKTIKKDNSFISDDIMQGLNTPNR
eukprot:TRINITY_DN2765_c0_g1_i1.p1 TRINITY_DN2765_c0_g1~~TRINITY_DN2765_c0_g1_i1.p1  ORF type:complete len:1038 (+),score=273.50 TRINITY_DN2765_c0_g1_i1:32-3115(+)